MFKFNYYKAFLFTILLCLNNMLLAAPFDTCPSKAFLMQNKVAELYGVNLVTGDYSLLTSSLGTSDKINAIGFNFHDNYIYGWGYEWGTIVRIGNDFQAEPLTIENNPDINFFVGDISINENSYFFYKKSSGLHKVSLDESSNEYLITKTIIDGQSLYLSIFDFAFHPSNEYAYSVDKNGVLHQINVVTGNSEALSNVGQTGTFGAVYFDVDGNFYISRNSDGYIFIIDISAASPEAEFFAYGPSASQNDGARCATAPIVDESNPATVDYGDAPDSYGTNLDNNGARHKVTSNYLGSSIDAEYVANVYPRSDDSIGVNDDDGIVYITPLISGLSSLIQVHATGSGYVNIWGDWNQNGEFSADEKLLSDYYIDNTTEIFLVDTPINALSGYTWTRARFSTSMGIVSYGGVADGEVEDYRVLVTNPNNTQIKNNTYFVAFEDNWPELGDYDMNDVVIKLNSSLLITEFKVKQLEIVGELRAYGARYRNGFAIQIDNVLPDNVNESLVKFEINGVQQNSTVIEEDTDHLVLMVTDDLSTYFDKIDSCLYYKTESSCMSSSQMMFSIKVPFFAPIALSKFPQAPFNPFIFAKPSTYHGDLFYHPGRGLEVHLKNKLPTSKVDLNYFGEGADNTNLVSQYTYQSASGLPWALAINPGESQLWQQPLEKVDLLQAYPSFQSFVETSGSKSNNWYLRRYANVSKLY